MCRMAIFNGIRDFKPLAKTLSDLEKSCGGDGNGYYNAATGELQKGVNLSPAEIAFDAHGAEGLQLFHTRFATAGGVVDDLCHPFDAGEYVLMHNGGWFDWNWYAFGDEESDTAVVASLVRDYGPGILLDKEMKDTGVYVLLEKETGYAYVIHTGVHTFFFQWLKTGGFFHASQAVTRYAVAEKIAAQRGKSYCVTPDGELFNALIEPVAFPESMKTPKKVASRYGAYNWLTWDDSFGADDDQKYWDDKEVSRCDTDDCEDGGLEPPLFPEQKMWEMSWDAGEDEANIVIERAMETSGCEEEYVDALTAALEEADYELSYLNQDGHLTAEESREEAYWWGFEDVIRGELDTLSKVR
ncbi:MAG: hypothetical protein M3P49_12745 [Actinomycetota bacterium]|nr:hypothetical protein [Actinomycetota bacterium]